MEFENFALNFFRVWILILLLLSAASLIFKKQKELVVMISSLIILAMLNYFIFTQKDFIFENFPKQAYVLVLVSVIMYFSFFRSVYSFIKGRKSPEATTIK